MLFINSAILFSITTTITKTLITNYDYENLVFQKAAQNVVR